MSTIFDFAAGADHEGPAEGGSQPVQADGYYLLAVGTQVGEVALHRARPDAHELGGVTDGSADGDVGGEDVHLAPRWTGRGSRASSSK